MANLDSPEVQAAIKEIVYAEVIKQFQENINAFNLFMSESGERVNVRGVRIPLHVRPNASGGYFDEGGALPVVGRSRNSAFRIGYTRYAMGFGFTGDASKQVDSPENLVNGLSEYLARDEQTLRLNFAQDVYGDGTGEKARLVKSGGDGALSTTITTTATVSQGSTFGPTKLLIDGRYDFIYNGAKISTGLTDTPVLQSKVNASLTATFDQVPSNTITDTETVVIVREGSYNKAFRGLNYHVTSDTSMYQGVSRSDFPELNATVYDAAAAPMSYALLTTIKRASAYNMDSVGQRKIIAPITQCEAIELLGHSLKRLTNDEKVQKIGFDNFEVDGVAGVEDRWCPEDRMFWLDLGKFKKYELEPLRIWDDDGKVMRMETTTSGGGRKDSMVGWYIWKGELACLSPRDQAVLKNLSVSGLSRGYTYAKA
jgi:hypothetical protein